MPRIRMRFNGGLHLTSAADAQPPGTIRRARNVELRPGKMRSASPVVQLASPSNEGSPGITIRAFTKFKFLNNAAAEVSRWIANGLLVTELLRKFNASTNTWSTVTLPTAITLTANPATYLQASPTSEKPEALFVVDQAGAGGGTYPNIGHLFKLVPNSAYTDLEATRWGIHAPQTADTTGLQVTVTAQGSKYVHTAATDPFESAADWTLSAEDSDGEAEPVPTNMTLVTSANPAVDGSSLKLRVPKDSVAVIKRTFGANIDLTTFGASASPDEDFIQFFIRLRRPKHIKNVEIAFDTTAAGDFKKDYFSKELTFKLVRRRKKKKLIGLGDLVPVGREAAFLAEKGTDARDLTFAQEHGEPRIPVAKNTWSRITLPKNAFDESGSPSWATVRAIRVIAETNKQGRSVVFVDGLKLIGGVGMIGDYKYTITYFNERTGTRSNPAGVDADESAEIKRVVAANVERQGVELRAPVAGLTFDPQVTHIEFWRTLGNGATYFRHPTRFSVSGGTVAGNTLILTDTTADYVGLHSGGATVLTTEELPIDNLSPNHADFAFQDAAGPHVGRMWWSRNSKLTKADGVTRQDPRGLVYYSPPGRHEAVQAFVPVGSGGAREPVQKIVVWNDRLFAFTTNRLYEIVGTDEPFVAQRVEGAPGTFFPNAIVGTPFGLFWVVKGDGVYRFNGQYAENITDKDLLPIFRTAEGDSALVDSLLGGQDYTAAFYGRHSLWLTDFAQANQYVYIFDFDLKAWRYREVKRWFYWDQETGRMIAATGTVLQDEEPITFTTTGASHFMTIATGTVRAGPGQKGVLRKLHVDADTVGESGVNVRIVVDDVTSNNVGNLDNQLDRFTNTFNVNLAGERWQVYLVGSGINNPVEFYGIDFDVYVPGEIASESGLAEY